ncbi:hypothetical protein CONLIGDRAFT_630509 [Coniochaeta ligniaria NRRL 30616]|uniref:Xylanolytic transcriptional activator regulatory domain-containing protein n=1 Tax=Coniochaeta ligniaria NRRL 30616 TaxID=1408157 RepID=A0A1J7ISR5_9PEZI|nr:hypothetical protein CONLIGDRAFT_630509 [Coniochaeta ligniaria NRRL 30616]
MPTCNICTQLGIECSYPTRRGEKNNSGAEAQTATPTAQAPVGPVNSFSYSPRELDPVSVSGAAAAVSFIAPEVFRQAELTLPQPKPPIPTEVTTQIGDVSSIRDMATTFFKTVHVWMPIISKKRFFIHALNPLSQRGPDRSLLILCMKLCCTPPSNDNDDGRSPIYRAAKRFHFEVEAAGVLSIHVLQATLLIAIYEMGHGIYPAAFLTVGACARYGMALGIHSLNQDSVEDEERQRPWMDSEEVRRAWWAVMVLDRLLNITNPVRWLSIDDPTYDTLLPVDDKAWDQGTTSHAGAVPLSAGFDIEMGLFARIAQATHLVSQALHVTSSSLSAAGRSAALVDETAQLRRTILALVQTADKEAAVRQLEYCPQSSICFSALLLLQAHNTQTPAKDANDRTAKPAETLLPETEFVLKDLSRMAKRVCAEWDESCANQVSLFLMLVVYQAASAILRLSDGNPDDLTQEALDALKDLLRRLAPRWRVAGIYLSILASEEATAAMAAI